MQYHLYNSEASCGLFVMLSYYFSPRYWYRFTKSFRLSGPSDPVSCQFVNWYFILVTTANHKDNASVQRHCSAQYDAFATPTFSFPLGVERTRASVALGPQLH